VLAHAKGVCALCRRPLNPKAKRASPDATEIDHYPTSLWKIKRDFEAGKLTREQYVAQANDPNGCRAVHRQCHEDPERAPKPPPSLPPPDKDGVQKGVTSQEW
jgi:hypothetical protein